MNAKALLALLFLAVTPIGALAQGQVQFLTFYQGSGSTPLVDARVYLDDGTTPLSNINTLWRAALLGGPANLIPSDANPGPGGPFVRGTLPQLYNPTSTTLSWLNFGRPPNEGYVTDRSPARLVQGVDWGGTALLQVVAWQGNYDTWDAAVQAMQAGVPGCMIGSSNPILVTLPSGPTDPNLAYLVGLNSFIIHYAPEPGAFALGGLGAAVLLIFRRRPRR